MYVLVVLLFDAYYLHRVACVRLLFEAEQHCFAVKSVYLSVSAGQPDRVLYLDILDDYFQL